MKKFFAGLRLVLLWAWFAVFALLLIIIMILCHEREDAGLFVVLEILWTAVLIVAGVVCETAAGRIQEIILISKIRGYKRSRLILENETFGRMTFWHYLKSGTLQLLEPKLSGFGEGETELAVCHYHGRECGENFFRVLEQLYSRKDEIRAGLCRCVLGLYASRLREGSMPFDEKYVEQRLPVGRITINLDDAGTLSAVVYLDMNSRIFEPVCTERLTVRAELDCDTGKMKYYS